ncbi:hypothetical protein BgiMline_032559 [Biomphalaria glabrata]|uniref:Uncharacterized protein LOC106064907 isoform X1 n=1 Tax=Biomphalaria glabrata TaxID=6526 RepID=A0A9U8E9I0_BIOGL|nr:uncharacterized protein LOC106064907 isoform X1 [Biomphalaria glabrata]KAI8751039.1 hypothetical protein BgiMline_015570 [Biomphalaria glabrata]KAI8772351.1 hypothetical protein BgiBS90_026831 [Biomphalaria glabrata]
MDNLLKDIKEAQSEKCLLEKDLSDKRQQRSQLEHDYELAKECSSQVQHNHIQLSDSSAVAEQKVSHIQDISLSFQEELSECMNKLNSLQQVLDAEKQTQITAINELETTLGKIATDLFQAKKQYNKISLNNAINETRITLQAAQLIVDNDSKELPLLSKHLEQLNVEEKKSNSALKNVLSICLRLLERDRIDALQHLNSK